MSRSSNSAAVGLGVFCLCMAFGSAAHSSPPPAGHFSARFNTVRTYSDGGRITAAFGRPMCAAATADEAAESWWRQNADVFGVPDLELNLVRKNAIGHGGRLTVYAYAQSIGGIPVEGGLARLVVRHGEPSSVVYVGAKLAIEPEGDFRPDTCDAATAVAAVRAMEPWSDLKEWSSPRLVVFNGETNDGPGPALRTWRFQGGDLGVDSLNKQTFFVDAATGRLVCVRDEVHSSTDVYGHVGGMGTPGVLPDVPYNPAIELDIAFDEVRIVGGESAFTDYWGNYIIANDSSDPVAVEVDLLAGSWTRVLNQAGQNLTLQQVVTPPGPADFLFNPDPVEYDTSQVNAFVVTTLAHDFFKDRQPDFYGLDLQFLSLVNYEGACDAYYNGSSAIYLRAGSVGQYTCPNTCYSSVIAHEYGHFVHTAHGHPWGAFGEGYADTYALLMFDYPLGGADFFGEGTSVRDYTDECEDYQYPCTAVLPPCGTEVVTQEINHGCGKMLAGAWWKIKLNIQDTMGADEGLEYVRQIMTDWTGITIGGQGYNSAHPQTAIEVLTVDDDDGNLDNGTPHYAEICAAFAAHGIECPAVYGDVNDDGVVDIDDIFAVLAAWGPCDDCPEDVNGDGVVDIDDLFEILAHWT